MLEIFILLIWVHFFADFVLQNDWMATRKSESVCTLLIHCLVYSIPLVLFGFKFAVINGLLHFLVDFFTCRITKYYSMVNDRRKFFLTIGFDQALHLSFLVLTYVFLYEV